MQVLLLILLALTGCRTAQHPVAVLPPPLTTADACASIRGYFDADGKQSVAPNDVTNECHMRFTSDERRSKPLFSYLEKSGWKRDPESHKGPVPSESVWVTPATRCTIGLRASVDANSRVRGGVGISGGTHIATGFGLGLGLGSSSPTVSDYKIDCANRT